MTKHENHDYFRVKITCTLITESPLHCGDGESMLATDWKSKKEKKSGTINTVCKSNIGSTKPYIPAATLRGSLRDRYKHDDKNILFGSSQEDGSAGKIRVYDAIRKNIPRNEKDQYQLPETKTTLQNGVSIDSITNTAKEHHLFTHEVVPVGSTFELIIELDRITKEQTNEIIFTLQEWNGSMTSSVGKGRSKGWGKLNLMLGDNALKIEKLTKEAIIEWIETGKAKEQPEWQKETKNLSQTKRSQTGTIQYKLYCHSPLLINDHARVSTEKKKPKLEYRRTQTNQATIPGSSLKGLARSHAERIVASIAHLHYDIPAQQTVNLIKPIIGEIFGKEMYRSLIWLTDAIADQTEKHPQFFNAVDRFTGGVAKTALYNVVAAECSYLEGECILDIKRSKHLTDNSWKGLLLLLIREFMEGDIAIGWGKSRGYGSVKLTLSLPYTSPSQNEFEQLLDYLEQKEHQPQEWIEALHTRITQEIDKQETSNRSIENE